ncbi:MAG: four helix bundle protein [Deltaproteobacteria bacterium]|nr:four helix bundle protein [Deltaproteobacteria bacterium]
MGSSFEDLEVWKKSCRLSVRPYKLLRDCRDYGMKDQMLRSSISIPSNIAEQYYSSVLLLRFSPRPSHFMNLFSSLLFTISALFPSIMISTSIPGIKPNLFLIT